MFEATTSRASVQTRLLKELLGLFGGNARPVMAHLVEMGKISREDIEDAQKLLRERSAATHPTGQGQMIAALINHLWQSTLVLRRRLVDHAGVACQWRVAAPLDLAAGVG